MRVTGKRTYTGCVGLPTMKAIHHRWITRDIISGDSALDLVNTVSGWNDDPEDWVPDIASFLVWTRTSGILSAYEKNQAGRMAERSPAAAARVLASVKELRFALWRLVDSLEHRRPAKAGDLSVIDEWARRLSLSQRAVVRRNKIDFAIGRDISALEIPGLRVITAALSFLRDSSWARIKTCPGNNCGWKFLDRSKNRSRRWCDMAVCGNLAKAKQYRARNS
jgi:predicted RNA-binding Zn ribbon-like protein